MRAPPRRHHILLGRRPARQRHKPEQLGTCASSGHHRRHSHRRRRRSFLRAPPRRHHILLGRQLLRPTRQRQRSGLCDSCAGCGHHRRHSHRRRRRSFLRAPPRRHHILLGRQLPRAARQRHNPGQLDACASCRLRRLSHSFITNALLSNTHTNKRNKIMTNQGNVSPTEIAQKLEEANELLHSERRWTAKLEKSLTDNGLPLPDRDRKSWRTFWRWFKSLIRRHWRCILVMLLLALLAIALWPHYDDGNLHWHWRDPFEALANFEQTHP